MRRITILGATGSVGSSAAEVIREHRDRFVVSAVVGGRDASALARVARELNAEFAALGDESGQAALREALAGSGIACGAGPEAVLEAAERDAGIVLAAISGAAGLAPTRAAMKRGRTLALANKESLVSAGAAFMRDAARLGVPILPVDSEHNALAQALGSGVIDDVVRMTLTASGGPFRGWTAERLATVTPEQALRHPTWSMGAKISIDSATLMNKGLELIEAHHLFGIAAERLDVLVHPQSIVHGLVDWRDGSVTAGLAPADMRVPIVNCLAPPGGRLDLDRPRLDLAAIGALTFERADEHSFRCLALARAALAAAGAVPTVLNAANEVAVAAFLAGRLSFPGIADLIERTLEATVPRFGDAPESVDAALAMDEETRRIAAELLCRPASTPI